MKRSVLILILGWPLAFWPFAAEAASRVYVSFGVGGAVAVGSGLVFWNVGYARELKRPPETEPSQSVAHLRSEKGTETPLYFSNPFVDERSEAVRPRWVEFPLFIFRW